MGGTTETITTALILGATTSVIIMRFRSRLDSNWPMLYYLALVVYHQALPGALQPTVVFMGVLSALFLRFEFLPKMMHGGLRILDLAVLGYIAIRLFQSFAV